LRPVVFKEAGHIGLWQYKTDGTVDQTDASTYLGANGTVESITPSIEFSGTEVKDGNSMFPMGDYDESIAGKVDVKFNSYQQKLFAGLIGSTVTDETGENMWRIEEGKTVPPSGVYTVTLDKTVATGGTIIIVDNSGSPLASVASGPAASQFTVSGATVTFNSADASKEVFCAYEWTPTDTEKVELNEAARRPFYAVVGGKVLSEDETATKEINILFDKCKATGNITPPAQQKNKEGWTISLKILKPRSGYKAVTYRVEK